MRTYKFKKESERFETGTYYKVQLEIDGVWYNEIKVIGRTERFITGVLHDDWSGLDKSVRLKVELIKCPNGDQYERIAINRTTCCGSSYHTMVEDNGNLEADLCSMFSKDDCYEYIYNEEQNISSLFFGGRFAAQIKILDTGYKVTVGISGKDGALYEFILDYFVKTPDDVKEIIDNFSYED